MCADHENQGSSDSPERQRGREKSVQKVCGITAYDLERDDSSNFPRGDR